MALVVLSAGAPLAAQEAPKPASPPAAVRQFRDAVVFQDRGVYDLAADEWQKFLKEFPADPLAAKARHYLGVCRLLLKQYDAAAEHLQQVIREHPQSELADSSYLNLGLA
ncbi:MAG: tetratricopeptide repeat protein, partial [Pirellulales bacterium]